jgi:hypothetical protein
VRDLISAPAWLWVSAVIMGVGALMTRSKLSELLNLFAKVEPELWRAAGEPSGLFAPPRGRKFFTQGPEVDWLTSTPSWAKANSEAQRLLSTARLGAIITVVGLVGMLAVVAWSW